MIKKFILLLSVLLTVAFPSFAFIGNTNNGTATDNIDQYINAAMFQASSNLTITNINARIIGLTGRYKMAIYNGNSSQPSTLFQTAGEITNPSTGWNSFVIPQTTLTNGQYYWFAIWSDKVGAGVYYSGTGLVRWETSARTYGNWPNTLTLSSTIGSVNYCIYADAVNVTPPNPILTNKVTLAWDPSPDVSVTGYRIYYGPASGNYTNSTSVGNVTNATLTGLIATSTYYFAATAYDDNGNESVFSNETSYTVPFPTNTLPARVQGLRL